jgi:tRNA dimethylallyltransferase
VKSSNPAPLVAIVGPTGSGKSALALRLAREFPTEIVNCDSLQLYRYFDIGTAKVPPAEREGVAHHLLDIVDPDQECNAGDYSRRARETIAAITARGRLPVVVGGTGFYLRALLEGLFEGPARDEGLRTRLAARERRRPGSLHRILSRLDPASARRIHVNDGNKLARALEVCIVSRRPMTEMFAGGRASLEGYRWRKIGLNPPRQALYARLDERCREMFDRGLMEEVRSILARGFPASSKPFESHGYRQAIQMLRGEITRAEALTLAQRNTRRYAKRQWTWFLRDREVEWFDGFGDDGLLQEKCVRNVGNFLNIVTDISERFPSSIV